jgi:hypothetical protein
MRLFGNRKQPLPQRAPLDREEFVARVDAQLAGSRRRLALLSVATADGAAVADLLRPQDLLAVTAAERVAVMISDVRRETEALAVADRILAGLGADARVTLVIAGRRARSGAALLEATEAALTNGETPSRTRQG